MASSASAGDVPSSSSESDQQPSVTFDHIFRSLARHSRVFPLRSEDVTILPTPRAFYEQLRKNLRHAQRRVTLSSLYLGTGELEKGLVEALDARLRENPKLQVQIVLDFSRGQRGGQDNSSVAVMKQLLLDFPDNVQLYLYKVPQLRGVKAMLPPPFNETMGVLHSKVYLADDTLILSGANLSHDYFEDRQDRYVQMHGCADLADFYDQFVRIVARHSHRVNISDRESKTTKRHNEKRIANGDAPLVTRKYELIPPAGDDDDQADVVMKQAFEDLVTDRKQQTPDEQEFTSSAEHDTWAFPTIQFTPIDMRQDEAVLSEFMRQVPAKSSLQIASGYLNFPPFLSDLLIQCDADLDIITAAPIANSFYDAHGVKGAVPMAYSLIEQDFYLQAQTARGATCATVLREFNRHEWTFHGKGMWWSPRADANPQFTVMGSSNFGQRSYGCDLESQLMLYTKSPSLQTRMRSEYESMARDAEIVTDSLWKRPDRMLNGFFSWKNGHWIRPVSKIIAAYF